ncbi:MAG: AAA family ATPase [Clostridia bacterium]
MKIDKIDIVGFGKLRDYKMQFNDGFNTIMQPNGYGKTTIAAFITAMFYGMPVSRKSDLEENPRKKYEPWSKCNYGGSLVFEKDEETYRIERKFGKGITEDKVVVYNVKNNEKTDKFGDEIGENLFGIDSDAFYRCVYVPQNNVKIINTDSISRKLTEMLSDVDSIKADAAIKKLDLYRQTMFKTGKRGYIDELKTQLSEIIYKKEGTEKALYEIDEMAVALNQLKQQQSTLIEKRKCAQKAIEVQKAVELEIEAQNEIQKLLKIKEEMNDNKIKIKQLITEKEHQEAKSVELLSVMEKQEQKKEYLPILNEVERLQNEIKIQSEKYKNYPTEYKVIPSFETLNEIDNLFEQKDKCDDKIKEMNESVTQLQTQTTELKMPIKQKKTKWFVALAVAITTLVCFIIMIMNLTALWITLTVVFAIGFIVITLFIVKESKVYSEKLFYYDEKNGELKMKEEILESSIKKLEEIALNSTMEIIAKYKNIGIEVNDSKNLYNSENNTSVTEGKLLDINDFKGLSNSIRVQISIQKELKNSVIEAEKNYDEYKESMINEIEQASSFNRKFYEEIKDKIDEFREEGKQLELKIMQAQTQIEEEKKLIEGKEQWIQENFIVKSNVSEFLKNDVDERESVADKVAELNNIDTIIRNTENNVTALKTEIREKRKSIADIAEIIETETQLREKIKQTSRKLENTIKTMEFLKQAETILAGNYMPQMRDSFTAYLEETSPNVYPSINLDKNFKLELTQEGLSRDLNYFSNGTKELMYFGLRLSLMESMFKDKLPFIILDDCFTELDDEKYSAIKKLLMEMSDSTQIIYLTCYRQ